MLWDTEDRGVDRARCSFAHDSWHRQSFCAGLYSDPKGQFTNTLCDGSIDDLVNQWKLVRVSASLRRTTCNDIEARTYAFYQGSVTRSSIADSISASDKWSGLSGPSFKARLSSGRGPSGLASNMSSCFTFKSNVTFYWDTPSILARAFGKCTTGLAEIDTVTSWRSSRILRCKVFTAITAFIAFVLVEVHDSKTSHKRRQLKREWRDYMFWRTHLIKKDFTRRRVCETVWRWASDNTLLSSKLRRKVLNFVEMLQLIFWMSVIRK